MDLKAPTLEAFNEASQTAKQGEAPTPAYSEKLTSAMDGTKPFVGAVENDFKTLGNKSPEERANIGGKMGAVIGGMAKGLTGSVIGAGVGAFAGRALGQILSGDEDASKRFHSSVGSLIENGVANKKGQITFADEDNNFQINLDPSHRLPNLSAVTTGKADRKITEGDPSSPFANRAGSIAKVLGYYHTWGVQKWADKDSSKDQRSLSEMTGLFANALTHNAASMDTIKGRSQHIASKYKADEVQMRSYFDSIKSRLPDKDALEIRKGLDLMYGGKP